jgi:monooxygenase
VHAHEGLDRSARRRDLRAAPLDRRLNPRAKITVQAVEHFDVLVIGAGLSGIGAACELQRTCPEKSFAILESREALGGTWDLFRYPGVRSDSDMFTLGYRFKPWKQAQAIGPGPEILKYVAETAREHGVDTKIRFGHRVVAAAWSSERARWTVEVERGPARDSASGGGTRERVQLSCGFLYACTGYYRYEAGYTPSFEGTESFTGRIVHPQHWTEDVQYAGKRVVVIGSGATAMTLVPALAREAAHVVMLQRSPTYVISAPARDRIANRLRAWLPEGLAYALARWKSVLLGLLFFTLTRRFPRFMSRLLVGGVQRALGPGYDVTTHFKPRYNLWEQRLCLVPDGDLFEALKSGRASVVTDHIERFTERGLRLRSGQELEADLVVTATGLELLFLGGLELKVDGARIEPSKSMNYKGCMFSGVPNLAYTFGYTNASWTLKADLIAEYVCRLLRRMDEVGATHCTPRHDSTMPELPWIDFSSGYVTRTLDRFPKQGARRPFRLYQNYVLDLWMLRHGRVDDGTLEFRSTSKR